MYFSCNRGAYTKIKYSTLIRNILELVECVTKAQVAKHKTFHTQHPHVNEM